MRQGELQDRWDVNYTFSSIQFEKDYSNSKYSLTPLRELVTFVQYGISAIATEEPVGVPMLRMNNLQDDGWDLTDLKYIDLPKEEIEKYKILSGDLLFNRTNSKELVGKCEVFREQGDWVFASYLIRVRLDETKALPDFISAFLSTKAGRLQIDRVSRQIIGMSNVNAEELRDLVIPLPDIKNQYALVSMMEGARAKRQSMLAEANSLLQGIDSFVLDELGLKLPKEVKNIFAVKLNKAKVGRLDVENFLDEKRNKSTLKGKFSNSRLVDVSTIIMGQAPEGKEYNDEGKGLPLVAGAADLGEIYPDPQKWTTSFPKKSQPNDIILCIRATIGNLNWSDKEYCLGRGVAGIRPNKSLIDENYLYEALWLRRHYLLSRGTGSTFKQITSEEIENCPIPLPPMDIQKKLAKEILNRRAHARQLREEAERQWQEAKEKFEKALLG